MDSRHRPHPRRSDLRAARSRADPRPVLHAVRGLRRLRRHGDDQAATTGGTDSTSFNAAGLPGIGLGQDPIEYNSHTWHTNLDTYERIVEEDVKKSAIAIASAVYHVAMRDQMLPRFTQGDDAATQRGDAAGVAGQ